MNKNNMATNHPIRVFLDSNVFINECYNFSDNGNLGFLLRYIKLGSVYLLLSNIVINEVEKHIREDVTGAANKLRKVKHETIGDSKRKVSHCLAVFRDMNHYNYLFAPIQKNQMVTDAVERFKHYISEANTNILDNSGVDLESIISDYFFNNPPFEERKNKKSEFPDAIMAKKLISMVGINSPIIIVSNDNGFKSALRHTKGFIIYDNLSELLDDLNRQRKNLISNSIVKYMSRKETILAITQLIENKLYENEISIDGQDCDHHGIVSGCDYEETTILDVNDIKLGSFTIDNIDEMRSSSIVSIGCSTNIIAQCLYFDESQSWWDPEEKHYLYSHYGTIIETHRVSFDVVITLESSSVNNTNISSVEFDFILNPDTRIQQDFVETDQAENGHQAEVMDTLEDYHHH